MAVEKVDDSAFESNLENEEKVMVKFYADWCGSCKLFAPKYKRLSNDDLNQNIKFLEINAEENEAARKKAGVDNLPFFAAFKNGELVSAGPTSKEDVVKEMIAKLH